MTGQSPRDAFEEPSDAGDADAPAAADSPALFRRLLVFQFKLLLDGLRDVILSPASVSAVLMGVFGSGRADGPFRALMRFGRRSDEWIDLFDAHDDAEEAEAEEAARRRRPEGSANALFDAVERAVREEYERGGGRTAIEARLKGLREGLREERDDPGRQPQ